MRHYRSLERMKKILIGLSVGMFAVATWAEENIQSLHAECPYPYAFFDPAKPSRALSSPVNQVNFEWIPFPIYSSWYIGPVYAIAPAIVYPQQCQFVLRLGPITLTSCH